MIYLTTALAAVVIIQSWFRRRQAIFEIRRKAAWTIYQNIEYAGEQDQLKVIIYLLEKFSLFIFS
jgi:serine/threonine-protein phosphatase with EF-hand domain